MKISSKKVYTQNEMAILEKKKKKVKILKRRIVTTHSQKLEQQKIIYKQV